MTDIQYSVDCYLGSRFSGCSIVSEDWEEVKSWMHDMITRFGAIARFVTDYRYME